jgi:hypothetical protein
MLNHVERACRCRFCWRYWAEQQLANGQKVCSDCGRGDGTGKRIACGFDDRCGVTILLLPKRLLRSRQRLVKATGKHMGERRTDLHVIQSRISGHSIKFQAPVQLHPPFEPMPRAIFRHAQVAQRQSPSTKS